MLDVHCWRYHNLAAKIFHFMVSHFEALSSGGNSAPV